LTYDLNLYLYNYNCTRALARVFPTSNT